ncbi:MAG: hypothetical protein N2379_07675 [Verrucomicrobiae bacterium]|nr:hypothetical protein [Verrucomicrobiae bacterium]
MAQNVHVVRLEQVNKFLKVCLEATILSFVIWLVIPVLAWPRAFGPADYGPLALAGAILVTYLLAKWRPAFLVVWLAAYVAVYASLSWCGQYALCNFGGSDNRFLWCPAYCAKPVYSILSVRPKHHLQPAGWFFLPLLVLDRMTIHPTRCEEELMVSDTAEQGN